MGRGMWKPSSRSPRTCARRSMHGKESCSRAGCNGPKAVQATCPVEDRSHPVAQAIGSRTRYWSSTVTAGTCSSATADSDGFATSALPMPPTGSSRERWSGFPWRDPGRLPMRPLACTCRSQVGTRSDASPSWVVGRLATACHRPSETPAASEADGRRLRWCAGTAPSAPMRLHRGSHGGRAQAVVTGPARRLRLNRRREAIGSSLIHIMSYIRYILEGHRSNAEVSW